MTHRMLLEIPAQIETERLILRGYTGGDGPVMFAVSQRVAKRCGFTMEGHVRENEKNAEGSFSGEMIFGMLKEEWEKINAAHASEGHAKRSEDT